MNIVTKAKAKENLFRQMVVNICAYINIHSINFDGELMLTILASNARKRVFLPVKIRNGTSQNFKRKCPETTLC